MTASHETVRTLLRGALDEVLHSCQNLALALAEKDLRAAEELVLDCADTMGSLQADLIGTAHMIRALREKGEP